MDSSKKQKTKKIVKKQLKKAGVSKGSPGRSYLAQMSPYLQTIADPVNHWGCKIPDAVTTPSFVVHTRARFQVTAAAGAGANNMAGLYVTLGSTFTAANLAMSQLTNGATADAITSTALTNPWASALIAVAMAHRVVSAELYMSYQGATIGDKGRCMTLFNPPNSGVQAPPGSLANDVLSQPILQTQPVKTGYAQVRYLPVDPIALSYCKTVGTQAASNDIRVGAQTYGSLVILCDGMTAGDVVEFTLYQNLECLPLLGVLSLAAPTSSKSDPIEMAFAANTLAANPNFAIEQSAEARVAGTGVISSPLLAAPTQSESSGGFLDSILGGIKKALPVAKEVASFAGPLLASLV